MPAVLDPEHRTFVNYEIYYFANAASKAKFEKNRLKHCGLVTDPIIRTRFRPIASSPVTEYMGRTYYFLTPGNLEVFGAAPDSFAVRQGM
jgi:YHS domain-containing protein